MAQALGGRYGLPHGAMNALCLPPALRFNEPVVPDAIARFGAALGADDPAARVEELARLGGFGRLRDFGVPEDELDEVAEAVVRAAGRAGEPAARERRRRSPSCCVRSGERLAGADRGAAARAAPEERCGLLELDAVRALVRVGQPDEPEVVEVEPVVVGAGHPLHPFELRADAPEHGAGACKLGLELGLGDALGWAERASRAWSRAA